MCGHNKILLHTNMALREGAVCFSVLLLTLVFLGIALIILSDPDNYFNLRGDIEIKLPENSSIVNQPNRTNLIDKPILTTLPSVNLDTTTESLESRNKEPEGKGDQHEEGSISQMSTHRPQNQDNVIFFPTERPNKGIFSGYVQ